MKLSYGETCDVCDRVFVKIAKGYGRTDMEYDVRGPGTVIDVREGVERLITVRLDDDGVVGRFNWKHIYRIPPER